MKYSFDMHIHSSLSPCASDDMTPNNIVNMAYIKKLNIISITDHNSMINVSSAEKIAYKRGILLIPGMEVNTKEEVHILCYFRNIEEGLEFGKLIYDSIPDIKNAEKFFGQQLALDEEDSVIYREEKLLTSASSYSIDEIDKLVKKYNGIIVPAHIDRKSYSILSVLGFIPKNLDISTVEISSECNEEMIEKMNIKGIYNIITNSDAHDLWQINEAENFMELSSLNLNEVFRYLRNEEKRIK
ncbi:PHP domain-containing protein [Sporanaerobacter sp. PP17-6a]|jgi:hypothetical protein|uniref:PHP domain-containing protein n=1 Tax=Sporanaerobacter sp. PP17-6a TaxID=1891289 RepID=UPI00089FBE63|nr:PHP domain-containing protein [Sporanaerobacter sp. PP17-6a]SCL84075.1 PHP domain protein [Sporanaerobacter sp. PP17-6a]